VTRALVVLHDAVSGAGYVGERAVERGVDIDELVVCRTPGDPASDVVFPDPGAYDLVLSFGAVWSVYDPAIAPWVERELAMLRSAHDGGIPVFGVCFGGQALSAALGGTVSKADHPEVGWFEIESQAPAIARGPWLQWHGDRFTVPSGGRELASSAVGPQAFVAQRSLGVQFHPEVTPEIVGVWTEYGREHLDELGIDGERLVEESRRHSPVARANAHRLFDFFFDEVAAKS
jgi:GMP synthase-like glutamine amidotransferase